MSTLDYLVGLVGFFAVDVSEKTTVLVGGVLTPLWAGSLRRDRRVAYSALAGLDPLPLPG